jgi:ankyrin repeat protein
MFPRVLVGNTITVSHSFAGVRMELTADIEAKDMHGFTHLHWACFMGHPAVVNELRVHGAFTAAKDIRTPLHVASGEDHLPVVKALLSGGADILAVNNKKTASSPSSG